MFWFGVLLLLAEVLPLVSLMANNCWVAEEEKGEGRRGRGCEAWASLVHLVNQAQRGRLGGVWNRMKR